MKRMNYPLFPDCMIELRFDIGYWSIYASLRWINEWLLVTGTTAPPLTSYN